MASSLAASIRKKGERFDLVIGIARGGIPLAMVISDELGARLDIITVKSYTGIRKRSTPHIMSTINTTVKGRKILIVDDLIAEGATMGLAYGYFEKMGAKSIKTAALFKKPWSKFEPDFYAKTVDRWVVFPWERGEFKRISK